MYLCNNIIPMSDIKEKEAITALEKLGYTVKLSKPSVKKTFEIEIELLEVFLETQKRSGMKIKEAVHEALTDWVKKRRVK